MKRTKKGLRGIAITLIALIVCFVFPTTGMAASNGTVSEGLVSSAGQIVPFRWTNTDSITVGLSFTGTTANCTARIIGMPGTTRIAATVTLERLDGGVYRQEKSWTQSVSGERLDFSQTHSVTRGFTYRLTVTADVTRNGQTETVTASTTRTL